MITVNYNDSDPKKPKTEIEVDNGDREALNDALTKWRFQDEASMLRFVIAVLREAKDKSVIVVGEGGKPVTFAPADHLLKPKEGLTDESSGSSK